MKIAFTGHTNIEKVCGIEYDNSNLLKYEAHSQYDMDSYTIIFNRIHQFLLEFSFRFNIDIKDIEVISGMARGIDEIAALVAINLNLKLILAIPNSVSWHKQRPPSRGIRAQAIYYDYILNYSKLEIVEIKKDYGNGHPFANFARNQYMVDIADKVASYKVYDSTGTDHCIKAAIKKGNYLGNIPDLLKKIQSEKSLGSNR